MSLVFEVDETKWVFVMVLFPSDEAHLGEMAAVFVPLDEICVSLAVLGHLVEKVREKLAVLAEDFHLYLPLLDFLLNRWSCHCFSLLLFPSKSV